MKKIAKIVKIVKVMIILVKNLRTQYQVQNYQTLQRIMFKSKTNKHSKKYK